MSTLRFCAIVPTLDNPRTLRGVVTAVRSCVDHVLVVDDGSGPEGRAVCDALAAAGLVDLVRLPKNRGKGAAVKMGLARAHQLGFTHALQVDADGQHDLTRLPDFLRAAEDAPDALVIGSPVYDSSAPRARLLARKVTKFWVDLEIGAKGVVQDALIGCRVYPVAATLASGTRANHMEFEAEVCVRMARAGVPIVNVPVGVRYLTKDEGGISHFRPVLDNLRISCMHARICTGIMWSWLFGRSRRRPVSRA